MAGKVAVRLASHWPWITDIAVSGLYTNGLKAYGREINTYAYTPLQDMEHFTITYYLLYRWWSAVMVL